MPGKKGQSRNMWTQEHIDWLRANRVNYIGGEATAKAMNEAFGTKYTPEAILGMCFRQKIKTGRQGWETHPLKPPKKGERRSIDTEFKPGNIPQNYRPIGSERYNKDGYLEIKIENPDKWESAHVALWIQHNGPIPPGHCVIFIDSDKTNIEIENLELVSRTELLHLSRMNLKSYPKELRHSIIALAKLECAVKANSRGNQR